MSCALFAPGWTHESSPVGADAAARLSREQTFWRLLRSLLYLRGPKLETGNGALHCPRAVFSSCFCPGKGRLSAKIKPTPDLTAEEEAKKASKRRGCDGGWWLDMTRQEYQSSFCHPPDLWAEEAGQEESVDYAFCADQERGSGAKLTVRGSSSVLVPLLVCELSSNEDERVPLALAATIPRDYVETVGAVEEDEKEAKATPTSAAEVATDAVKLRLRLRQAETGDCRSVTVSSSLVETPLPLEEGGDSLLFPLELERGEALVAVSLQSSCCLRLQSLDIFRL